MYKEDETNFKIQEEHRIHYCSCQTVFIENMT